MPNPDHNRLHPRENVRWAATWNDGLRTRTAEVRDVSRYGLFLSPAWRSSTTYNEGDPINVRLRYGDVAMDIETVVRWTGKSRAHGCEGIGLKVVSPTELEPLLTSVRAA